MILTASAPRCHRRRLRRWARAGAFTGCCLFALPALLRAAEPAAEPPPAEEEEWSAHAQATVISEQHDHFPAKYSGANSLEQSEPRRTSVTATLFLGARLPWKGGEIFLDPEIAGGEGFSGVTGIAGFPNGDIQRVSSPTPTGYVARLFYRQTLALGNASEKVEGDVHQLAGTLPASRMTITLGKVSAADFFDGNAYSHDPRGQFMNWALMDNGAWDYPADTRGYTFGGVVEWKRPGWGLRYGAFSMPKVANGAEFDHRLPAALGQVAELERSTHLLRRPGTVRLLVYRNGAHMGSYRQAIESPGPQGPDVTLSRAYRVKYGFGVRLEQKIARDLGAFAHLGWNDGHTESFAFTEIDRTAAAGLNLTGSRWHREDDVVGIAAVLNGLSADHRDYLRSGGYGFILGDGRLRYGYEEIAEVYYRGKIAAHLFLTADFQFVEHPAYNRDRGPVAVAGTRAHVEF